VERLLESLPCQALIWGGDWNNSLDGRNLSGSKGAADCIMKAVKHLGLQVPTRELPHRLAELRSIDHIAVARGLQVAARRHVIAAAGGERLSDHDLYWVEIP